MVKSKRLVEQDVLKLSDRGTYEISGHLAKSRGLLNPLEQINQNLFAIRVVEQAAIKAGYLIDDADVVKNLAQIRDECRAQEEIWLQERREYLGDPLHNADGVKLHG